jgi:signal transduction histidine kinase
MAEGKYNDPRQVEDMVADRLQKHIITRETFHERIDDGKRIIEVQTDAIPLGGIVVTYTNITERVESAEALARANESLEARVRERTAELTQVNEELALAKSKADEANLDKTRFLVAASHDILQPLNAARLYATSLVERNSSNEDDRLIRNVDASLESVEEIINALLDISRLDAGAMKPECADFPLDELFKQLRLEFHPLAEEKNLQFRVIDTELCVSSDRRLLRRVLQNLVSNAIKYTDHGKVLLGCRRMGDHVKIEILDTGPGIPEPEFGLIFKEFQRLSSTSRKTRGLGLGLSIVERIAKVLQHEISVESVLGRGSVFRITLPIAVPVSDTIEPDQLTVPRVGQIKGCAVLCIDNEEQILDGMEELLSNWQCPALKALNARDAVKKISEEGFTPDILLVDYHLDENTGMEAISYLRSELSYNIPAIIITADRSPEITEKIRAAGHHLLRKPLKPAQLRALMAQHRIRRIAAE